MFESNWQHYLMITISLANESLCQDAKCMASSEHQKLACLVKEEEEEEVGEVGDGEEDDKLWAANKSDSN